jgi:ABC-type transport system involved in cytochrome bd biosynthesis fused ATPase/permease subunit
MSTGFRLFAILIKILNDRELFSFIANHHQLGVAMGIFRHYLTLALFAAGLLFGVQAPNFVDQYEKRIDAHLIEARAQLAGFIKIAENLYAGDMQELIAQHADSGDATFNAEHQVLTDNYQRLQRFEAAKGALETQFAGKLVHVLFSPEHDALKETARNYTAAFPLTTAAIVCGLAGALFVCLVFELVVLIFRSVFRGIGYAGKRRHTRRIPRHA